VTPLSVPEFTFGPQLAMILIFLLFLSFFSWIYGDNFAFLANALLWWVSWSRTSFHPRPPCFIGKTDYLPTGGGFPSLITTRSLCRLLLLSHFFFPKGPASSNLCQPQGRRSHFFFFPTGSARREDGLFAHFRCQYCSCHLWQDFLFPDKGFKVLGSVAQVMPPPPGPPRQSDFFSWTPCAFLPV